MCSRLEIFDEKDSKEDANLHLLFNNLSSFLFRFERALLLSSEVASTFSQPRENFVSAVYVTILNLLFDFVKMPPPSMIPIHLYFKMNVTFISEK